MLNFKILILLALAFTLFACSGDSDDGGTTGGTSSGLEEGLSSSSVETPESSSSSKGFDTVKIGEQVWMKKNLNVVPTGTNVAKSSWCYDNDPVNCEKYGRLYGWATAMALPISCEITSCVSKIDTPYHQGICPEGFHIPTDDDWNELFEYIDKQPNAEFEFSVLPGGICYYNYGRNRFEGAGNFSVWWISELNSSQYHARKTSFSSNSMSNEEKINGLSVRCIKD